jgi:glutaminase
LVCLGFRQADRSDGRATRTSDDDTGKWLYRTDLPGKSGVGGVLIAVSSGKVGIAVISPPLDEAGNSVRAQKAVADISNALVGNPLASKPRQAGSRFA